MSWVTIIWAMIASACLTLALVHVLVWWQRREAWANLLFALTAVATAVFAGFELWMMRAETPVGFGMAVRWAHVPAWVLIVSLVGFVRLYLRAGRLWLAWTVCGVRTLSLILNFVCTPNLNYREITALRHVSFLGETVVVAEGVPNPWMLIGQLSLLLLVIFVADAAISVWWRGDRRQALSVGGSIVFFVAAATGQAILTLWGIIHAPITVSLFFMALVAAMGYELSQDVFRAAQLSDDLRESEARFRTMADTAPVMIWMSGTDKLCTFFNKGWLDFTGRRLEQELGNGWAEGVHREDFDRCLEVYVNSFDARETFTMEYRLRRSDGEYRWVLDIGTPRFASNGTFLGYIGSCIDITERKQAQERFRFVVEASPNGIVLVNAQGHIVLVNACVDKLFGYEREELIGQNVELLVPERFRGEHPAHRADFHVTPVARAMGAGRELFARRKDGTEFPVEIGISPIQSPEGTLVLSVIVDITARRQAEAEARQHREEIAHLSRVAIMGEMAGSLAHELNQPLGAIVTNAGAALRFLERDSRSGEKLREVLQDIVADGRRASDVIRTVKGMGRKEEGARQLLHLNDVIAEVVRLTRSDALVHDCTVLPWLHPSLPKVEANLVQLQEVFLNLILNAFEASEEVPRVRRRVIIRTERDGDGAVRACVRDFGTGLPADMPERVFDRFFSTKREGMGIGLFIARSIVVAHGGTLYAENAEGGGAQFWLRFPASKEIGV